MHPYFPDDTYDTPDDTPRLLMDRLCFGGSFGFYLLHLRVIFSARSHALNNRYNDVRWAESSYTIFKNIEGCGGRFHLSGLDNLRNADGPLVIISNHMSSTETQTFPCIIAPFMPVTFIVKESLVSFPLFGPIMRSRNPITVSRKNPREDMQKVMQEGPRKLQNGISLIVFPQSTRRLRFMPDQFNSLGVKLARRAGVKAMPVAIKTDFWGNGRLLRDFGRIDRRKPIYMHFGEPVAIQGNGREDHKAMVESIRTHLAQWGAEVG